MRPLESRRAAEIAKLIRTYGGDPIVVPALREIPPESNQQTLAFVSDLMDGKIDMVIFLTGVGVRALMEIVETKYDREDFLRVLRMVKIASRGPKPTAALRELKVPIHVNVPEPSTWRELTQKLEQDFAASLPSLRVAVQEYGTSNPDLLSWLSARCEAVTRVAVYQWALPEDIQPLRECVVGLVEGLVDVVLFTTSIQIVHLFEVARQMGCEEVLRTNLAATAIFSIGPTTTEELKRRGLTPELEPAHPKMGFLVNEAAQHANSLLQQRRNNGLSGPRTGPSAASRPASQRAEPGPAGSARAAAPVNQPVAGEMESSSRDWPPYGCSRSDPHRVAAHRGICARRDPL